VNGTIRALGGLLFRISDFGFRISDEEVPVSGSMARFVLTSIVLVFTLNAGSAHTEDTASKPPPTFGISVDGLVRHVWTGLGTLPNACPDEYDYFPSGGMRIFACHLFSACSYDTLVQLFGRSIFLSGPHTTTQLSLNSSSEFGHYDPEFVRWMRENFIPASKDETFRKQTQGIYDSYVQPKALLFDATYRKAAANPECWRREVERYKALLQSGQLPEYDYERFFFFMNEGFCSHADSGFDYFYDNGFDGGYDGNVVKTSTAFWIRRSVDGTADEFYRGLQELRLTYEGDNPPVTLDK